MMPPITLAGTPDVPEDRVPWDRTAARHDTAPTDLGALLGALLTLARRYVVLTAHQAIAIVLWTAHTHTIEAADTTPYLHITSATKRAGKTRLLEVLEQLVARPWFTSRTSPAALVRKVDAGRPTLLLDESDAAFSGEKEYAEALRGLLNSGYKRSGKCTICVGKGAEISVRDFSTFGAKAIAGIGRLPDTVADRAIPIVLRRRMASEPVERWRERVGRLEAAPLRDRLQLWSRPALDALRSARPALPARLSDRAADVWEPLLAIADFAGGDWPTNARRAAEALMGASEDTDPVIELLTDLELILTAHTEAVIPTRMIIEALVEQDDRPWATWRHDKPITARGLARLLGPLGIHPDRHLRTVRGYRRDVFDDAIARYLPSQAAKCHTANNDGPKSRDTCDPAVAPESASVTEFRPDFPGCVTHDRISLGDDSDRQENTDDADLY
jgi:Protein of unknown function (DUF3631)